MVKVTLVVVYFILNRTRQLVGLLIGAFDHMTFDPQDLKEKCSPKCSRIVNANGVTYPVTGAGRVALTPSFLLSNTLLAFSLTNKLLSVGQATEELNYCVLIYPNFCLFQDILTKKIIDRGTKRGVLYCMDDYSMGMANNVKYTNINEYQIWLWHRHLGHPSFLCLKHLFSSMFS